MLSKKQKIEFLKKEFKKQGLEEFQNASYTIVGHLYKSYREYDKTLIRIKNINGFLSHYVIKGKNEFLKDAQIKWELETKPFKGVELVFEKLTLKSLKYINEVKEVL